MEWTESPSFPGYAVSRCGKIRGPAGGILSPRISNGYEMVGLYNGPFGGPQKTRSFCRVHRLVAEAYLPDWDPELTVDHIDRDRRNNRASNLRMATMAEQHSNRDWANHSRGKRRRVERVCPETGAVLEVHASMTDGAAVVGGDIGNIWSCIAGKTNTSYGYSWRYHVCDDDADVDGEVWKEHDDSGVFVSDLGRFKRKTPRGFSSVKRAREFPRSTGYPIVGIGKRSHLCHRLVAALFLGEPPGNEFVVNHVNGDKTDASLANLEWATRSENSMHAHDAGLARSRKRIVRVCPNSGRLAAYDGICAASRSTGVSRTAIGNCLSGASRSAGGFGWRRIDDA